jgi:starch synthase (maltosyl-transferring)
MPNQLGKRVIIENISPEIESGRFPIKRVIGEKIVVSADVFADGHDLVAASLMHRPSGESEWEESRMTRSGNDRWEGSFRVTQLGTYQYTVLAWIDYFATWQKDLEKKVQAGQDVNLDLTIGAGLVTDAISRASGVDADRMRQIARYLVDEERIKTAIGIALSDELKQLMAGYPDRSRASRYDKEPTVVVDNKAALFSTWYEFFPRSSFGEATAHATFKENERILPEIARMGFDVIYLPPIHPIGISKRKGRNNSTVAEVGDPGSPWAIGSEVGGHKEINPELGTLEDFRRFVREAEKYGISIALDLAFQASPDHPYLKSHQEWFTWRPDGRVQYAENPPKKYEDVLPFNFESERSMDLWQELKSVVLYWIENGVRIFRVDNPHTKPIPFWEWLIAEVKQDHPDIIFLAEAFTRPSVMYRLAKIGFTQSYTYFTWRNSKKEIESYLTELTQTEVREYFRPNFWPNTPDILPEYLQFGGRPAFVIRLVLAATLSSNYGIYGPAFELLVNDANPGTEEYFNSEKYEVKQWNWSQEGNLRELIARVNRIRRENVALQSTVNMKFCETDDDYLLAFTKLDEDLTNLLLVVVNVDPFHARSGVVRLPLADLGIAPDKPYLLNDLVGGGKFVWQGEENRIELDPYVLPAHIFRIQAHLRTESQFDYFM